MLRYLNHSDMILFISFPMNEKAEYSQTTLQLEAELPFSISLTGQLFLYDTISYRSDSLPVSDDIPLPVLDDMDFSQLNPKTFYTRNGRSTRDTIK